MQVQVGTLLTWITYSVDTAPNPLLKEGYDMLNKEKASKVLAVQQHFAVWYTVFYEAANWDDTGATQIASGLQVPSNVWNCKL